MQYWSTPNISHAIEMPTAEFLSSSCVVFKLVMNTNYKTGFHRRARLLRQSFLLPGTPPSDTRLTPPPPSNSNCTVLVMVMPHD